MDKYFICLANSYKHGNRCLAGIEVTLNGDGNYSVIRNRNGDPKWIRPISKFTDAGAIPTTQAKDIKLFDIVVATQVEHCPQGAQQENYFYDSLSVVGNEQKVSLDAIRSFLDTSHSLVFGNRGAAVHPDTYESLDYSILLIHPENVQFYLLDRSDQEKKPRPKVRFSINGDSRILDLPITDPVFRHVVEDSLERANSFDDYYFAISLGVQFDDGYYYKLVASVIPISFNSSSDKGVYQSMRNPSGFISYDLFSQGLSISEIAKRRGLTEGTICTHLLPYIENGLIDIATLIPHDTIHRVKQFYESHPKENSLKYYYEGLGGDVHYNELKMILASFKK